MAVPMEAEPKSPEVERRDPSSANQHRRTIFSVVLGYFLAQPGADLSTLRARKSHMALRRALLRLWLRPSTVDQLTGCPDTTRLAGSHCLPATSAPTRHWGIAPLKDIGHAQRK